MQREVLELIEWHAVRGLRDAHDGLDADTRIVDGDEVRNEALAAADRNVDAVADLMLAGAERVLTPWARRASA